MEQDCTYYANQQQGRIHLVCDKADQSVIPAYSFGLVESVSVVVAVLFAVIISFVSVYFVNQWETLIVFRFGKFRRVSGPGIRVKLPFIESAQRVSSQTTTVEIKAEKSLTKDTVPVNVQAVLFYRVVDAEKATIAVEYYETSATMATEVAIREIVGATNFTDLLSQREDIDERLRIAVKRKTDDWGIEIVGIDIRDVQIPAELQDAMSREAQAERERHARVILGQSEVEIAQHFVDAAKIYGSDPIALQLRSMNIIYETTKERGATILLPSNLVDAMAVSRLAGVDSATPKV